MPGVASERILRLELELFRVLVVAAGLGDTNRVGARDAGGFVPVVTVLKPVQASVVNGAPFSVPSIFSSMKRPPNSGWIVDTPFDTMP